MKLPSLPSLKRSRDNHLQYEFLPAALEITETPTSPFGPIVVWLIVALLATAFLWSCFGEVDEVAIAHGKIIPDGNVKIIQPPNTGIVKSIDVRDGQRVKAGQKLIELDSSLAKISVDSTQQSLDTATLEKNVLERVLNGENPQDVVNASSLPDNVKQDLLQLGVSKNSAYAVKSEFYQLSISQYQSELSTERDNQTKLENSVQIGADNINKLKGQLAQASTTDQPAIQSQLQTALTELTSAQGALQNQKSRVSQVQSSLDDAKANLNNFQQDNTSSTASSIVDIDQKIADLTNTLEKAKNDQQLQTINSPVDGIVMALASNTIGGVVSPTQQIMTIVPDTTPLVIEASIQNQDIGFVRTNQDVAIKVDTFPFQQYGTVGGKVDSISPDSYDDNKGSLLYKSRITYQNNHTSIGKQISLSPGMSVSSEIKIGQRRIIQFFLDPIIKTTDESLKVQ